MAKKKIALEDPVLVAQLLEVLSTNEDELVRIMADPVLFCHNMLCSPLDPTQLLELRDYQINIIRNPNPRKVIRIGRRGGKTLTIAADAIAYSATHMNQRVTIVSASDNATREIFFENMVAMATGDAPISYFLTDVRYSPPYGMSFITGSKIQLFTAGVEGRTIRGQCVVSGTLVRMGDGSVKEIQNVEIGDAVVAYTKEGPRISTVSDLLHFEDTEVYDLILSNGVVLSGAENHPVLTSEGWRNIPDIEPNTKIAVSVFAGNSRGEVGAITPEYMSGVLGSTSTEEDGSKLSILSGRDGLVLDIYRELNSMGSASVEFKNPSANNLPGVKYIINTQNIPNTVGLLEWIRQHPSGSKQLSQYLSGYLDCRMEVSPVSGGAQPTSLLLNYTPTSMLFLFKSDKEMDLVASALEGYGISTKSGPNGSWRRGAVHQSNYPVSLSLNDQYDRLRYFATIDSKLRRYNQLVVKTLAEAVRYVVPSSQFIKVRKKKDASYPGGYTAWAAHSLWLWEGTPAKEKKTIAQMLPEHIEAGNDPSIKWVTSSAVKHRRERVDTHDLTIEDGHSFVTNGIVSHNSASKLYIDEMDYIPKAAIPPIWLLLSSRLEVPVVVSSTPSGNPESIFRQLCTDTSLNFKQFHYPSHVSPFFTPDQDALYKRILTDIEYQHEILAQFADIEAAVFPSEYVRGSKYVYECPTTLTEAAAQQVSGNMYYMGVDWNEEATGINIIITERIRTPWNTVKMVEHRSEEGEIWTEKENVSINDGIRLFYVETVKDKKYTQVEASQRIKEIITRLRIDRINADRGHGSMQTELIGKWLQQTNRKELLKHFRITDFSTNITFDDPVTGDEIKVRVKPFMVRQVQHYLEEYMLCIDSSRYDVREGLPNQMTNYRVKRVSANGIPVYGPHEKGIGDHELDAFMLTVMHIALDESDMFGASSPVRVVTGERSTSPIHPRVDRIGRGKKHVMDQLLGPPRRSAPAQNAMFADNRHYHIVGERDPMDLEDRPIGQEERPLGTRRVVVCLGAPNRRRTGTFFGTSPGERPRRSKF